MNIKLINQTCNYKKEPISVGTISPCFSWVIKSGSKGVRQKSYQIIVSDSAEKIVKETGSMWDTGWVESNTSVNVEYKGKKLQSDTTYYWTARIRDDSGIETQWTAPWKFTMAFLKQTDWTASFIGCKKIPLNKWPNIASSKKSSIFRREYMIEKEIVSARAYFSGLGWGEIHINGNKVGNSVLDPGPTDYRCSVPYVVYDVLKHLIKGNNAIGIEVGNGWFSEYGWPFAYGAAPKAMLQINIKYSDGTSEKIYTDKSWKTINGPILENRFWGGEYYDSRLEQCGWTLSGFDDTHWENVKIKDRCQGVLKVQEMPPVKIMNTIIPKELYAATGIKVFDMQQLFGGWSKIYVKGERGATVKIKYSDRLDDEGFIDQRFQKSTTLSSEEYTESFLASCTDTYILSGKSSCEVYEPKFTYHPVQYVQIEYNSDKVELIKIEGRHTHQDVDFSGEFICSNELFNKIHNAVVQAIKNQAFGIPLDCLNREHWGWIDPASIAGTFYPRQYMPLYWRKWAEDIRESQYANGAIPDIAPHYIQNWNNPDPIWGGSFIRLIWFYYQYYDDITILKDNYDSLKRLFEYHSIHKKNGILTEGTFGDHMMPGEAPGKEIFISQETTYEYLWTGWYFESANILSRIAEIFGNKNEEEYYADLAAETCKVINNVWFDKDKGFYDKGSQTAQYYALAAGFVPGKEKQRVLNYALKELDEKYHGNHHTGNTGTTAMLDCLGDLGYANVLHEMINQTSYPGWGYMIDNGATSIWESWSDDNEAGCELSMTMYTTVDEFFFNELAGIKGLGYFGDSLFDKPGFKTAVIAPFVPEDMEYAKADIRTVYGRLASGWTKKDGKTYFDISLPGNTDGILQLPYEGSNTVMEDGNIIWEDGKFVIGADGIKDAYMKDGKITFTIGSGDYCFEVK